MMTQAIITMVFIIGLWSGVSLWRWRKRRQLAISRLRGKQGEQDAERWLYDNHFTQIESQTEQSFAYVVDGELCQFKVRPDFFARYQGQRWLIEVKTGKSASPEHQDTRRQIREYAQLWPNIKYGLFDADQGTLKEVSFKKSYRISKKKPIYSVFLTTHTLSFVGGILIGVYLYWFILG
jgi:hypothetical protein